MTKKQISHNFLLSYTKDGDIFMVDESRLLNSLLYVLGKLEPAERGFHKIFKILWFADIASMRQCGRLITDDTYIKMEYGPVPSSLYDFLKGMSSGNPFLKEYARCVSVQDYMVTPLVPANTDCLSGSDIAELDKSIEENRHLTMDELTQKSHGLAWKKSEDNHKIHLESILDEIDMPKPEREMVMESYAFSRAFVR